MVTIFEGAAIFFGVATFIVFENFEVSGSICGACFACDVEVWVFENIFTMGSTTPAKFTAAAMLAIDNVIEAFEGHGNSTTTEFQVDDLLGVYAVFGFDECWRFVDAATGDCCVSGGGLDGSPAYWALSDAHVDCIFLGETFLAWPIGFGKIGEVATYFAGVSRVWNAAEAEFAVPLDEEFGAHVVAKAVEEDVAGFFDGFGAKDWAMG